MQYTAFGMTIREHLKQFVVSFTREILAMWFAFWDRRVSWYVKFVLAFGVVYIVSPYDLIPDTKLFWGQIDDIVVLRVSHLISRKIIDPVILDECRSRATKYLATGAANKLYFFSAMFLVWGFVLFLVGRYLTHKLGK
jgi:uncharacterized membrane protein YkvA (DUF1232 family)